MFIRSLPFSTRCATIGLLLGLVATPSQRALAIESYTPGSDLSSLTTQAVNSLIETAGFGADHRAYMAASPLSPFFGVDIGMDVTAIQQPKAFIDAMAAAGVTATMPQTLYFPRFNAHIGLPFDTETGFSWVQDGYNKVIGGDFKWSMLSENPDRGENPWARAASPFSLALRYSKSWVRLYFMKTQSDKLDVLVSKRFGSHIEPYFGVGNQWVNGSLDVPIGSTGLTVSGDHSRSAPHVYMGFPIRLSIVRLTGEYDYSFLGMTTYGMKISGAF